MRKKNLTVGLLVAGAGTATTELLGLGTAVVGNQECAVVLSKSLLQLVLGVLIDVLLVVGDNGLGDGLTDGVDLGSVTTTGNTDTDVDTGELVSADDQEGLVDLEIRAWIVRNRIRRRFPHCHCRLRFVRIPSFLARGSWWSERIVRTLKRRISGWTRERGWPLTLTRPLPCCKKSQHVVQFHCI